MVQFNLPKNSKILKGQFFKDKTGSSNIKVNENPLLYNLTPNIKISKIDYLNRRNETFS